MTGAKNPSWKGGATLRNRKGNHGLQPIKYVRCPQHLSSMSRKDGYATEHRIEVAKAMGRPLLRSEVVHHINHDATDNRIINLMLFATNAEHKRFEHGQDIKPIWCGLCHFNMSARSGVCECRQVPLSLCAMA